MNRVSPFPPEVQRVLVQRVDLAEEDGAVLGEQLRELDGRQRRDVFRAVGKQHGVVRRQQRSIVTVRDLSPATLAVQRDEQSLPNPQLAAVRHIFIFVNSSRNAEFDLWESLNNAYQYLEYQA